jgi:hypothetical protein
MYASSLPLFRYPTCLPGEFLFEKSGSLQMQSKGFTPKLHPPADDDKDAFLRERKTDMTALPRCRAVQM